MEVLRQVAAVLSVQADAKPVTGFMAAIDGAKGAMLGLGGALAGGAILAFAKEQIDAAAEIGKAAKAVGVSSDDLQRAASYFGGSADTAGDALFFLNKQVGAATTGNADAAKAFTDLGVSLKWANGDVKASADLLPDVLRALADVDMASERTTRAFGVFGKGARGILPALGAGVKGIDAAEARFDEMGGGISEATVKGAQGISRSFKAIQRAGSTLSVELMGQLFPGFAAVLDVMTHTAGAVVRFVKSTSIMHTAMPILAAVFANKVVPSIWAGVRAFGALRVSVFGASVPFVIVAAAIALVFLAVDDLWTLLKGGDSLIGAVLDKLGLFGTKQAIIDAMGVAWASLKDTWKLLEPLIDKIGSAMSGAAEGGGNVLLKVFVGLVKAISAATTLLSGFIDAFASLSTGNLDIAIDKITKAGDAVFGKQQSYWDPATGQMVSKSVGGIYGDDAKQFGAASAIAGGAAPALAYGPVASAPLSQDITQSFNTTNTFNVATAGTGAEATTAIRAGVSDSLRTAQQSTLAAVKTGAAPTPRFR